MSDCVGGRETLNPAFLICPLLLVLAWPKFLLPAPEIYVIDYAARIAMIGAFLWMGGVGLPGPERRAAWWKVGAVAVLVGLALPVLDVLRQILPLPAITLVGLRFPSLDAGALLLFDLTVGLVLVAVSEEIAFRKVFWALWRERGWPGLTVVSSVAFGLLHAPQGVAAVAFTSVSGLLLMAAYRTSGTLWVPIVLHYVTNLLYFGGFLVG